MIEDKCSEVVLLNFFLIREFRAFRGSTLV